MPRNTARKPESERIGHSIGKAADNSLTVRKVAKKEAAFSPMKADKDWPGVVKKWYKSIEQSSYSVLYEPSDWMTAYLVATYMCAFLSKPTSTGLDKIMNACDTLLVTEGARRKARVEITDTAEPEDELAAHRRKMADLRSELGAA